MAKILILHGPNLNLLGQREPEIYGAATLADIDKKLAEMAEIAHHQCTSLQSNSEEKLIEAIQNAPRIGIQFILINPAAFTHTSIALRDALLAVDLPLIEVHLSNPHTREPFRHRSYVSDIAKGIICGFGAESYYLAMTAAIKILGQSQRPQ